MKTTGFTLLLIVSSIFIPACNDDLPSPKPIDKVVWLEQNWSQQERQWFHHANQGTWTFFIPLEWFTALEQPGWKLWGTSGLISDTDFLTKLGFIAGEIH